MDEAFNLEGRTYGTVEHPLAWGQVWYLLVIFILTFRKNISWRISSSLIFLGVINIFLCGSRSSLIALFVSIFVLGFMYGRRHVLRLSVGIAIVSLCFLTIADNTRLKKNDMVKYIFATVMFWDDSYARDANIIGSSSDMRNNQLEASVNIAFHNPFGGGFDYQSYARETNKRVSNNLMGLESIVFKKLVEQGFIGLLVFFVCFWMLYYEIRKYAGTIENKIKLLAFSSGYLTNILFTGLQGSNWSLFVVLMFYYYHTYKHNFFANGKNKLAVRLIGNSTL